MFVQKDLVAASSVQLVLAVLRDRDSYGYEIIKTIRRLSEGRLEWTEGMLYPVLHRLEDQGFVESYTTVQENGRKRKYYRITGVGRRELDTLLTQWNAVNETIENSLREAKGNAGTDGEGETHV